MVLSVFFPILIVIIAVFLTIELRKSTNADQIVNINEQESTSEEIKQVDFNLTPEFDESPEVSDNTKIVQKKFTKLIENVGNKDIVGHLKIDGTTIDYPVLQKEDNDYYLERDINGNYDMAGSIFLDYENNVSLDDKNTVIYGHNMNKDYMFHSLRYYQDPGFFEKHRYITFDTLYGNQTYEVFAFYKTDIDFNYINVSFESDDHFNELIEEMKNRSFYETNVEVKSTDKILTLSTCSNQESDTRFVVNAKLVDYTPYTALNKR